MADARPAPLQLPDTMIMPLRRACAPSIGTCAAPMFIHHACASRMCICFGPPRTRSCHLAE
eukprot:365830-Chlamydomonas_euryale.AAC.8